MKGKKAAKDSKPPPLPKKYVAFSVEDNRSIESAYQRRLEDVEDERTHEPGSGTAAKEKIPGNSGGPNTNFGETVGNAGKKPTGIRVPVNEDFLFDVDIEERELAPAYWLGPVYDVCRGTWFTQDGSTLKPCEENLAAQLEEGYLKTKPWLYPPQLGSDITSQQVAPKASTDNTKADSTSQETPLKPTTPQAQHQPQTHRLFGTYMNQIATYHDATTAWLSSDGMLSWVTSTMYERLSNTPYMGGVKHVRGYAEPQKPKEEKRPSTPTGAKPPTAELDDKGGRALKRRSAPPTSRSETRDEIVPRKVETHPFESRGSMLQRQLSSLMESTESRDSEDEEEAIRKREEEEIQDDYNARLGEAQGREIEHLVLVTHGIGQLLGMR